MNASKFAAGQDRTGQDRTGQDRTGQDRTGQDRTYRSWVIGVVLAAVLAIVGCTDDKKKGGDPCAADPFTYGCPNNPCIANPTLEPCITNPCLANPYLPQCPDPCLTTPSLPQCQVIDPCVANPTLPQCGGDPCLTNPTAPGCQIGPLSPNGTLTITGLADWNGKYVIALGGDDGELFAASAITVTSVQSGTLTFGLVTNGTVALNVFDMRYGAAVGNKITSFEIISHTSAAVASEQMDQIVSAAYNSGNYKEASVTFVNSVGTGVAVSGVDPCLIDPTLPQCQVDPCIANPTLPQCQTQGGFTPSGTLTITGLSAWNGKYVIAVGDGVYHAFGAMSGVSVNPTTQEPQTLTLGLVTNGTVTLNVYDMENNNNAMIGNLSGVKFMIFSHTAATVSITQVSSIFNAAYNSGNYKETTVNFVNSAATGVATDPVVIDGPLTPNGTLSLTGLADWNGKYVFGMNMDEDLLATSGVVIDQAAQTATITLGTVANGTVMLNVFNMDDMTAVGSRSDVFAIISHTSPTLSLEQLFELAYQMQTSPDPDIIKIATVDFTNSTGTGVAVDIADNPCLIVPELCDDVTIPPATHTPLTHGTWSDGSIPVAGGEQWFSFTALASTHYIHFSPGTLDDVDVEVYSSTGTLVDYDNLYDGGDLYFSFPVTPSQLYYVRVTPYYGDEFGAYQLAFNSSSSMGGVAYAAPKLSKKRANAPLFAGGGKAVAKQLKKAAVLSKVRAVR